MLRAIGRTIRGRYEQRARETSTVPFQFNIMTDPRLGFLFSNLLLLPFVIC